MSGAPKPGVVSGAFDAFEDDRENALRPRKQIGRAHV